MYALIMAGLYNAYKRYSVRVVVVSYCRKFATRHTCSTQMRGTLPAMNAAALPSCASGRWRRMSAAAHCMLLWYESATGAPVGTGRTHCSKMMAVLYSESILISSQAAFTRSAFFCTWDSGQRERGLVMC